MCLQKEVPENERTDLYSISKRVLTSIVKVTGGNHHCCSVKTNGGIPKEDIEKAMELLKPVQVKSPVHIRDVVVSNVRGIVVDWIATKNV